LRIYSAGIPPATPEEGEGAVGAPAPSAPPEEGHVIAMWVHLLLAPKKSVSSTALKEGEDVVGHHSRGPSSRMHPHDSKDTRGQLLIKAASFDEVEPASDVFTQWRSTEDSDTIVDLVDD
jgi:hypothetical protein